MINLISKNTKTKHRHFTKQYLYITDIPQQHMNCWKSNCYLPPPGITITFTIYFTQNINLIFKDKPKLN